MIDKHEVDHDNWPGGISDGLTLRCSMCGQLPDFDCRVADPVWQQVVPEEWRTGVVCLACLDALAGMNDVDITDQLEIVQFTGSGKTIVLVPVRAYLYPQEGQE